MKSRILLLFSSLTLLVFCFNAPPVDDIDKEKVITKVRQVLTYLHFSPKEVDDSFSEDVYNRYLESLDPYKRNFIQADIVEFAKHKDKLDDYFNDSNLSFYNLSLERYYQRMAENEQLVEEILTSPINLDEQDELIVDEKKKSFSKNSVEKKAEWKKYLKYMLLDEIQTLQETDDKKDLPKAEMVEEAKKEVLDNMKEYFRKFKARKKEDIFSYYMNAYAEAYDPHTYYFSPKGKEEFDVAISGSFFGIGASLLDEKGYATIKEVIIGSPAWKTKKVFKEDKILEVAEKGKEAVNIVGMALDDAIRLIRGKKGSEVTLTLKRADGTIEKVVIERDKIEMEEAYVKSTIIKDEKGVSHGYVSIPSFYIDMNDRNGRNVSDDLKLELIDLKKEGVKSIILDVRNNGGGSLSEVVEMVGLFIKNGPVVQVKSSNNDQKTYYDTEDEIVWDGPLVVMINEFSASASEILAGAIQDYNRGLIIGSTQTYGKGTVQQVFPLDRFSTESASGDLKLTIQKFYRINGSSTQIKGVKSDIVIPDRYELAEINEGFQENALKWESLAPLTFEKWVTTYNLESLKQKSQARIANSSYIKTIIEEANFIKNNKNQEKINLQYDTYFEELKKNEQKVKDFEKNEEFTPSFTNHFLEKDVLNFEKDTIFKAKREDWQKNIKKDFYLQETINVINDAF